MMDQERNLLGYKVAYAPWETYNMEPSILRFPHEFEGHRHLAVGGIGGGPAGGGTGAGSEGGGAGAEGAFGGGGVGAVGAFIASQGAIATAPIALEIAGQPAPASPTLVIGPQRPMAPAPPTTLPAPQPNPLIVSATMGRQGGPPPALTVGGQRGGPPQAVSPLTITNQRGMTPTPPPTPPGPQQGTVPHLTLEDRAGCTTCGAIRSQQDELRTSIKTEQQQLEQQRLSRQEGQIQQYQQREQSGQQYSDQELTTQIQDKIALLQQLNDELAQAQQDAGVSSPPPPVSQPGPGPMPTAWQRIQQLVAEAEQYTSALPSRIIEGLIHEAFPFLADTTAKALADAVSVLTPPGMIAKLNQLRDKYLGQQPGQVPSVKTPPPPPPPPKAIRMCMICESAEDAVRWQAGEPTPGCAVESVRETNPEDFANRG